MSEAILVNNNPTQPKIYELLNTQIQQAVEQSKTPPTLIIATAYFSADGWALLADQLQNLTDNGGTVKLLLGTEPYSPPRLGAGYTKKFNAQTTLEDHTSGPFSPENRTNTQKFIDWVKNNQHLNPEESKVQVRMYDEDFLHGKTFTLTGYGQRTFVGSANLTVGGLLKNSELGLANYAPETVKEVEVWFNKHWENAKDYTDALLEMYEQRIQIHSPNLIYLRMLSEYYQDTIPEHSQLLPENIQLLGFQLDGANLAQSILDKYNGVIITDSVGFGKTYTAAELIHRHIKQNRQKVLVIASKVLRDSVWKPLRQKYGIYFDVLSYEDLVVYTGPDDSNRTRKLQDWGISSDPNSYSLVVLDEAHNLRNIDTRRAEALIKLLAGTPPKKVVMLTATPVNNSLLDLYNLFSYYIKNDQKFSQLGIPSLHNYFQQLLSKPAEELQTNEMFNLLNHTTVKRTRAFIKEAYPESDSIKFPQSELTTVKYSFKNTLPGIFDLLEHYLNCKTPTCENTTHSTSATLSFARYNPSKYLKTSVKDLQQEHRETNISGLMKANLLKRFESSTDAFLKSLQRMKANNLLFIEQLDKGNLLDREQLAIYAKEKATKAQKTTPAQDSPDNILNLADNKPGQFEEIEIGTDEEEELETTQEFTDEGETEQSLKDYHVDRLRDDVVQDNTLIDELISRTTKVQSESGSDPKLLKLVQQLSVLASNPGDSKKVLVFTQFSDTATWLYEQLLSSNSGYSPDRVAVVTGSLDEGVKSERITGFAPKTTLSDPKAEDDRFDVLIATDLLAEGVNLQQACNVINYDLPWNPTRVIQRHGRVDRLNSEHDTVNIFCFFPDADLDRLLHLVTNLRAKLDAIGAAGGVDGKVLDNSVQFTAAYIPENVKSTIEKIESGDTSVFTAVERKDEAEMFRWDLTRAAKHDPAMLEAAKGLPLGSGTVVLSSEPFIVFCYRIRVAGRSPVVEIQPAKLTEDSLVPGVSESLWLCKEGSGQHKQNVVSGQLDVVYRLWSEVRDRVVVEWNEAVDPRNTSIRRLNKTFKQAIDLLERHGEEQVAARLRQPYSSRLRRQLSSILGGSTTTDVDKVGLIKGVVLEFGLEAGAEISNPEISVDDVVLVAWFYGISPQ